MFNNEGQNKDRFMQIGNNIFYDQLVCLCKAVRDSLC